MTLVKYRYSNPLDNFLSTIFNEVEQPGATTKCTEPKAHIIEGEQNYTIELAMPGVDKKHISMNVENDELIVKAGQQEADKGYHLQEFRVADYERSFYLPESVDQDKIKASYNNGILTIELPVKEEVNRKKEIAIA